MTDVLKQTSFMIRTKSCLLNVRMIGHGFYYFVSQFLFEKVPFDLFSHGSYGN